MKKLFVISLAAAAFTVSSLGLIGPRCKDCGSKRTSAVVSSMAEMQNTAAVKEKNSELHITAKSAFLLEANSGKVLFSKDENKRLPIASMVKVTTLAVIYDALESGQISMGDMVKINSEASGMGGSQAFLDLDSEYSVEDLIKSIIIASANDSCVAMAGFISGSETMFVAKMNELAAKLGLENTNYTNCTGLPAANNYSCAADVAKVYQYLIKSPFYNYRIASDSEAGTPINKIWMYDLKHPSGRITGLTNTNRHARFFNGCEGGKTGFTAEAGHCITVTATRGQLKPIAVIIGASDSQTRFAESGNLMNYVFSNYENKLIIDASKIIDHLKIKNAMQDTIPVYAKENFYDLVKKGEKSEPEITVNLNKSAKAPINAESTLGTIVVTESGKVICEIDIVAGADIEGLSYWDAIRKIAQKYKI